VKVLEGSEEVVGRAPVRVPEVLWPNLTHVHNHNPGVALEQPARLTTRDGGGGRATVCGGETRACCEPPAATTHIGAALLGAAANAEALPVLSPAWHYKGACLPVVRRLRLVIVNVDEIHAKEQVVQNLAEGAEGNG
jgi:hypothetical protein